MSELRRASDIRAWPEAGARRAKALLAEAREGFEHKIIAIDDDPTGVQTMHGVHVYTAWDQASLDDGFERPQQLFFVLSNSRGMDAARSRQAHQEMALRILRSAGRYHKPFVIISRSDSTLRGHYPLETETLRQTIEAGGGPRFDGEIICPFFLEGGRVTIGNVHYVREGEWLRPAAQTEFARDQTFGYSHSHLGEWCEEKTTGRFQAADMCYISLDDLRALRVDKIAAQLQSVRDFGKVIVNAAAYEDVAVFLTAYLRALKAGRQFIFRSAAAIPRVLGGIGPRPLLTAADLGLEGGRPGLVIVGSHVRKTTLQLEALLAARPDILPLEFRAEAALEADQLLKETERLAALVARGLEGGRHVALYTSRRLLEVPGSGEDKLRASVSISDALTRIVAGLKGRPGFIIAKGGITSSDIGVKALKVRRALVWGQILPGVPVWQTDELSRYPGIPYVIFPGNVGGEDALLAAFTALAAGGEPRADSHL